jgi:dUTP pyrophosphatase
MSGNPSSVSRINSCSNDKILCECYSETEGINPYPYYKLFVYLDNQDDVLMDKYETNFKAHRDKVNRYLQNEHICLDAGIDIFCKDEMVAYKTCVAKVKTGLKCAMYFLNEKREPIPSGFYMYPRSSTGSSTPLRLANSVGIIDSGYRGELMGCFDNIHHLYDYPIEKYQRLLQICSPQLTYPIYPVMVKTIEELDPFANSSDEEYNERGAGGFGSTGK